MHEVVTTAAVVWRCSAEKVFLEISKIQQELVFVVGVVDQMNVSE